MNQTGIYVRDILWANKCVLTGLEWRSSKQRQLYSYYLDYWDLKELEFCQGFYPEEKLGVLVPIRGRAWIPRKFHTMLPRCKTGARREIMIGQKCLSGRVMVRDICWPRLRQYANLLPFQLRLLSVPWRVVSRSMDLCVPLPTVAIFNTSFFFLLFMVLFSLIGLLETNGQVNQAALAFWNLQLHQHLRIPGEGSKHFLTL